MRAQASATVARKRPRAADNHSLLELSGFQIRSVFLKLAENLDLMFGVSRSVFNLLKLTISKSSLIIKSGRTKIAHWFASLSADEAGRQAK